MALLLEAVSSTGVVQRTPISSGRVRVTAQQGFTYRLLDDTGARFDQTINIRRDRNALVIDGLADEKVVELTDFFFNCVPSSPCTFVTENLGGAANITPASEPVGALQDGTFMMFTKGELATAVPVAPEAEFVPKNILVYIGGLALLGAAAGGAGGKSGGGGGPDTTPPDAPLLTSNRLTKDARPMLQGTSEAGSVVVVSLDIDNNGVADVTYETQADASGLWSIDTATAIPSALSLPAGGLLDGANVRVVMRARDAAGNLSPVASSDVLVVDRSPPAQTATITAINDDQPTLTGVIAPDGASNDLSPSLTGSLSTILTAADRVQVLRNGIVVGEATVTDTTWTFVDSVAAGSTLAADYTVRVTDAAGNAGPASTAYSIRLDTEAPTTPTIAAVATDDIVTGAERAAGVTVSGTAEAGSAVAVTWGSSTLTTTAAANGAFSVGFAAAQIPASGAVAVSAVATDAAGNASAAASRPIAIDVPATISRIDDDIAPLTGPVASGASSNDSRPSLFGTLGAALPAGASLHIFRNGVDIGVASVSGVDWSFAEPAALPSGGTYTYNATIQYAAGSFGAASASYVFVLDTAPPAAPTIAVVAGNDSVSVAERAAGVAVSGAAEPGSTVSVTWGSTTLTTVASGGSYSITFTSAQIPAGGSTSVTAVATDAAGNVSAAASRTVGIDTAPTQTATIATITDNVAPVVGVIASGGSSNDATPTLDGTLSAALPAGTTLHIFRNGTDVGTATTTGAAGTSWTFTDGAVPLVSGTTYSYTARAIDTAGNSGPASAAYGFIFDAATGLTAAISTITDDFSPVVGVIASGGTTNDPTPVLAGTLSAALPVGSSVHVLRNGVDVGIATASGTTWSFTDGAVALVSGTTYSYTAVVQTGTVTGAPSAAYSIVFDNTGPAKTANVTSITDDVSPITGAVAAGGASNDSVPTIGGTLTAALASGETIHIFRNGVDVSGGGIAPAGTTWSFTDTSGGMVSGTTYTYTARVLDSGQNPGAVGASFAMVFDNVSPVPVIGVVAGNDIVDAAEKAAGVSVTGTAEAGSSVAVTWGATTLTTTASAAGAYSASFTSAQIPADGPTTVSAIATDTAGNVSAAGSHPVVVSTGGGGFTGTAGPDTFTFTAANQVSLGSGAVFNGAGGVDTLSLSGGTTFNLNLTAVPNTQVISFERVDITGAANNTLTLNSTDVLAMGGASLFIGAAWGGLLGGPVQLVIDGNAGDIVVSGGWGAAATTVINSGVTYAVYNAGAGASAVQLLVDTAITRNIT